MMIRAFADPDRKLVELVKGKLAIGTRPKSPSGILWRENFYKDETGDFDAEVLYDVEQNFRRHYAVLRTGPWQSKEWPEGVGRAFVDWVAAMRVRTGFLPAMTGALVQRESALIQLAYARATARMDNSIRTRQYAEYQDLYERPLWKWKVLTFPVETPLVITDNPVSQTSDGDSLGPVTLVPLSKHRLLIGGMADALISWQHVSAREVNAFLGAWAGQHVFAADAATLRTLVEDISGRGTMGPPEWCAAACRPFFGMPERAANAPAPSDAEVGKVYQESRDRYGPSISPSRG